DQGNFRPRISRARRGRARTALRAVSMGRRQRRAPVPAACRNNYRGSLLIMLNLPILRWGQPYTSLEQDSVIHFLTGETLAKVSQANTGLLARDMRFAQRARDVLTEIPIRDLIEMMKKAGNLYSDGVLPTGDGEQSA